MKRWNWWAETVTLAFFMLVTAVAILLQAWHIDDLQHEVKRLEAMIASHEEILVPKAEQRGE